MRPSEALFRVLLLAYPAGYRRRFGSEAAALFRAECRDALAERGVVGVAGVWARVLVRMPAHGVAERWTEWRSVRTAGAGPLDALRGDVRLALRGMRRSVRHSLAVVLTFALAISATAIVFSVVGGVLLTPLPVPHADRLVVVGEGYGRTGSTSLFLLDRVERGVPGLELSAVRLWEPVLTGRGDPTRLRGARVTADYFETVGLRAALGRTFRAEEGGPVPVPVAVLGHDLWRGRFGSDPSVVGTTVQLSGESYEVVGVLPPRMRTPDQYLLLGGGGEHPALWTPMVEDPAAGPSNRIVRGVGRLAPTTTVEAAREGAAAVRDALERDAPEAAPYRLALLPLHEQVVAGAEPALLLLAAAILLVLGVACANVMNLVLARGMNRHADLAVRRALGASSVALVRTVVVEVLLLALVGAAVGLALGAGGLELIHRAAPPEVPVMDQIRLDVRISAAVILVSALAGLVAGLVPALSIVRGAGSAGTGALGGRSRGGSRGRGHRRLVRWLATAQVAFALALLVDAGLLVRSFQELLAVDPGFDPKGVHAVRLELPDARYAGPGERLAVLRGAKERLLAEPGVEAAGVATTVPRSGVNNSAWTLEAPGAASESPWAYVREMDPDYLETLRIPLLRGRRLREGDAGDGGPRAALVSERFATLWFPDREVLGQLVTVPERGTVEIVGVTADVAFSNPGNGAAPEIHVPWTGAASDVFLVARVAPGREAGVAEALKRAVQAGDPLLPVERVRSLDGLVHTSLAEYRVMSALMGGFAVLAALLAAVGIYGVLSHAVSTRARELGIRAALGARRPALLGMVLRDGAGMVGAGLAVGAVLGHLGSRLLRGMLFGVGPGDPATYLAVGLLLGSVGLLACWLPARRATRADPSRALRAE